jgi:hypothetical protein
MKFKRVIWFGLFLVPFIGVGQALFLPDLSAFSNETLTKAGSSLENGFMTPEEQKVVFYMNLVRLEPQTFSKHIVKPYIAFYELNSNHYVKTLYSDLKKAKSTNVFAMKQDLFDVAKKHLDDIGKNGIGGHTGSKRNTFEKRVAHLLSTYNGVSENIGLGFNSPLDNVMGLLIDDGVKSLGHRKAILSKDYNCVGVAIGFHKEYDTGCVMDFGLLEIN